MRKPKSSAVYDEDNPLLFSARSRKNINLSSPRGRNEEIDRIIDYSKASAHQSLKRQMNSFFADLTIDFTLKTINGILSLILVIEYIYALYVTDIFLKLWWGLGSFLIHLYLFCEYICRIYSAKDSKKYFFSLESRIDLISNVPFFIFRFISGNPLYDDPTNLLLSIGNVMSILRLMRLESYQRFIENEVNRQLTNITLTILTLILFGSASLQLVEELNADYIQKNDSESAKANFSYQFYIFQIITTISTLGYENAFPAAITRVFLVFLILVSLFIIPTKSSQLISIFSSKSVYARMKYKTTEQVQHIIVTGAVSNASAYDFFSEFFHEDHGIQGRHGVLLLPNPPDSSMESMIRNQEFGKNIFYIQGDALKEADLRRCQAEKAKAIIILCNKQSSDANEEDATTILQAMFIKKYLKHARAPQVKVCMQILRPEGKTHYYLSLNKQTKSDQVLCVEELKLSLLAKSCLCPGLIAMVSNLISSSGEPPKRAESDNEWLEDYWHGKGYEVYKVYLSSEFHGQKFSWVAAKIYKKFRAILFALELGQNENARMYNNPGDYVLPRGHRITAYVISEDKEIADAISDYKVKQEDLDFTKKLLRKSSSFIKRASVKAMTITHIFDKHDAVGDDKSDNEDEDEDPVQFPTKLKQENFNQNLTGEFISLEDGFHLSPSKTNLIDVSFKTMENNILATNHIILCGLVSNLRNFVLPLRAKYLEKYPPIVILHVSPPTEKQWNQISFFPEIYFVKGSAMNMKDLQKVNIKFASRIVVLSAEIEEVRHFVSANEAAARSNIKDTKANSKKLTRDQEDLLDAKTIFKYKAISKLRPDLMIVTELVSPQNLGFLIADPKDYATMKKYGQVNTPTFASGSIYLSSMIDNLICQAYYNPSLNTVLNQLIVGSGGPKQKSHVTSEIQGSNLYHFPIPKAFVDQTFEKVFEYLSKYQNIIPLALYRQGGVKGNKLPYVVTNPDPETVISDKDVLFILSQKSPPASSAEWGAPFETRESDERTERNIMTNRTVVHNQDMAINYEEVGKENLRHKKLNLESELAVGKIREMVVELKKVREDIEHLKDDLEQRQKKILVSIRKTIGTQIGSMLPVEPADRKVVYDDDDMLTASPASSISQ